MIEPKKSGRRRRRPGGGEPCTATAIRTGTAASTSSPARLRRRPKISRSSERRNRVETAPDPAAGGRSRRRRSATDIEALPGQRDEHVLQRRARRRGSRAPGRPACTQRGDDLLRGHARRAAAVAERRSTVTSVRPELAQDPRGRAAGWSVSTRARVARAGRAARRSVPWATRLPDVHDADVGAHLLDLGQQVAGDQHGGALVGQRRRPASGPRGCPAGRARWWARRAPAGRAGAAARRRSRAAAACPASRRGSASSPRRAARPGRARRRPGAARCAGRRCGRRRRAGRRLSRPERYGWKAGPSTSAPTRGSTSTSAARASAAPSSVDGCPRSGGPGRAASGSSWSCRTRWARGSRRPRPAAPRRSSGVDRRPGAPNRLVSPEVAIGRHAVIGGRQRRRRGASGAHRADRDPAVVGEHRREQRAAQQVARAPAAADLRAAPSSSSAVERPACAGRRRAAVAPTSDGGPARADDLGSAVRGLLAGPASRAGGVGLRRPDALGHLGARRRVEAEHRGVRDGSGSNEVKPTSKAGLPVPRAKTWTRVGTWVRAVDRDPDRADQRRRVAGLRAAARTPTGRPPRPCRRC